MKKLLATLLAGALLTTPAFVFAAEEEPAEPMTLPVSYGFEDDEQNPFSFSDVGNMKIVESDGKVVPEEGTEETPITEGEETQPVVYPHSGSKMLKMFYDKSMDKICALNPELVRFEANTRYKISFWHRNLDGKAPYVWLRASEEMFIRNVNRNIMSATNSADWQYYEMFFVTTADTNVTFNFIARAITNGTTTVDYFDDFRVEKLNGASVNFFVGTPAASNDGTVKTFENASRAGSFKPATTWAISGAASNIHVYPAFLRGTPATEFTGTVTVTSQYYPDTLDEKATLMVCVYKDVDGKPVLQDVICKPYTYGKTDIAEGAIVRADYPAHQRLNVGINHTTISADDYEEGAYIKAYMWSSSTGMLPMSGAVVLGK